MALATMQPTPTEDSGLVAATLAGDPQAFETLVERYQTRLFGLVRHYTRNPSEVEDIVQETYLRALDDWGPGALPDAPLAWLKRVARNLLIDHLRRQKKAAPSEWGPGAKNDPETSGDEFESLELFLALTSLGRKKAAVLEAFYYDGLSVREIAAERGLSEKAVEGLLRRARQALKALLPE